MSEAQFNVVFIGVLKGFDKTQVQTSFADLFSLSFERTDAIFAASRSTLKSSVSEAVAQQYITRLAAIGVEAVAEPVAIPIAVSGAAPVVAPAALALEPMAEPVSAEPAAQPQAASQSQAQVVEHDFAFFGKGGEYFKIWIVNILLSIVTLGIYSAWAKVRNLQYFYGNTQVAGASFEYTAKPLKILIGRILALILLVAYSVLSQASPLLGLAMFVVLLIALPWIVVLSLRFNARYTSYRNIRFDFHGSVWDACKAFVFWPIAGVFTMGILFPFAWQKQTQFIVANHSYGTARFTFSANVGEYFKLLLTLIGASVVFGVIVALFMVTGIAMLGSGGGAAAIIAFMLVYLGFILIVSAFMAVSMANIQYNNSQLETHAFAANWEVPSYIKLLFVNTLFIVLTLGLYIPFAKVRTAAYKAEHTQFLAKGDLDSFVAAEQEQSSALAEGVNDLFALDISI